MRYIGASSIPILILTRGADLSQVPAAAIEALTLWVHMYSAIMDRWLVAAAAEELESLSLS